MLFSLAIVKIFVNFTGKHLCRSLLLISFIKDRLQHSATIFHLPRGLQDVFNTYWQDVFKTSWNTKYCYAEDVLKTTSRHVLKAPSRHLEEQRMFAGVALIMS